MGTATMAKTRGRKRKLAKRTKSGQISRAGQPRDTGTPELARRILAMKGKGTPALMTDRLCAAGLITDEQNQAAALYRLFRDRGYGKPDPKIGGYGELISEGTLRPIMDVNAAEDPQARAQAKYNAACHLIRERGYPGAAVEITRVVIDNAAPVIRGPRDLKDLQHALALLAEHFLGVDFQRCLDNAARSAESAAQEMHGRKCA